MNTPIVVMAGIVIVVATILVLVAARREPDAERTRTFARYVDSVNLLSVYVALFAGYAVVAQLTRFIIDERHRFGGSPSFLDAASDSFSSSTSSYFSRGNDLIWRSAVQAALVLLAALVILVFHRSQRRRMVTDPRFDASAASRVDLAFRYCVCFVAAFVILMALAFGLYGIFRIAAPGVAVAGGGSSVRQKGIGEAISLLVLGGGAYVIFRLHWAATMIRRPDGAAPPATAPAE